MQYGTTWTAYQHLSSDAVTLTYISRSQRSQSNSFMILAQKNVCAICKQSRQFMDNYHLQVTDTDLDFKVIRSHKVNDCSRSDYLSVFIFRTIYYIQITSLLAFNKQYVTSILKITFVKFEILQSETIPWFDQFVPGIPGSEKIFKYFPQKSQII